MAVFQRPKRLRAPSRVTFLLNGKPALVGLMREAGVAGFHAFANPLPEGADPRLSAEAFGRTTFIAFEQILRDIEFEVIVSQGCRPIGEPFAITKAEQNILYELRGKPAFHVLTAVLEKLSPEDQRLAQHSLFAGLAMDELRTDFKRGDFLIRNILGIDPTTGALAVGAMLETGQTVQFQLRDASASEEDLKSFLTTGARKPEHEGRSTGGVLVSCCGRGKGLFGVADHDVRMIQSLRGPVPLTGFFANGEFGPVDRKNYIHGYTSSLTLIR